MTPRLLEKVLEMFLGRALLPLSKNGYKESSPQRQYFLL